MTTPPLVSIIIPCYKGEKYLPQAIESAINQTHPKLDIVVVNDASPDHCPDIIKSYQRIDPRISFIQHSSNRGVAFAWNTAMSASRGAYIIRLAQDDILLPNAVASMLDTFARRPEADVVYAGQRYLRDGIASGDPVPIAVESRLFREENKIGLCVMIRRNVFMAGLRYDSEFRAAEDLDFFIRAFDAGFHFARHQGEPLLLFRQHEGAVSSTSYALQQIETARILIRREKSWFRRSRIYSYTYKEAAYSHRNKLRWSEALKVSFIGLCHAPFSWALWKQVITSVLRIPPSRPTA